jgi:uncharacterized membrane protein YeaQ/YmgE (transglycosylase-associated protein family)
MYKPCSALAYLSTAAQYGWECTRNLLARAPAQRIQEACMGVGTVVTLLTVAVLVGWLATLILNSEIDNLSLLDFAIAVTGAGITSGLVAPFFGIRVLGEYGVTLSGTLASWAGAMVLLATVNWARYGHPRQRRKRRRSAEVARLRPREH